MCNIAIPVFYHIINKEERPTESALSEFNNVKQQMFNSLQNSLENQVKAYSTEFQNSIAYSANELPTAKADKTLTTAQKLGFKGVKSGIDKNTPKSKSSALNVTDEATSN